MHPSHMMLAVHPELEMSPQNMAAMVVETATGQSPEDVSNVMTVAAFDLSTPQGLACYDAAVDALYDPAVRAALPAALLENILDTIQ